MTTKQFPFLLLPPELRLQIYEYIVDIPTPYTSLTQYHKPLIVINDTGNQFTTRPTYRALHISPKWVGISDGNRKTLSLLSVNRQIHAEVEDFLYTTHTLFFLNGFDLDHLGNFLDTLSPTARRCIRNIGFEVYLFIHNNDGSAGTSSSPPKRSFRQYERAAAVLGEKLPSLRGVMFYLDPWFSACCDDVGFGPWSDERTVLARGVGFLIRAFGAVKMKGGLGVEMDFLPTSMRLFGMRARSGTGTYTGTGTRDDLLKVR